MAVVSPSPSTSMSSEVEEPAVQQPRSDSVIRRQLLILALFPFGEAIAWTTIFPYMYAMVESLSAKGKHDGNIATYAGILVGAFTLGESIGAPIWARISDAIGRKPTLLMGNICAITCALIFGCSTSLRMAVTTRILAGISNPNVGIVQTYVGEMVSKEQQAKSFSTVAFYRTIGTIVGPPLGGYLAEPVSKYTFLFKPNTIWDRFPYLLPNFVAAFSLFVAALLALFLLDEVHPQIRHQRDISTRIFAGMRNILHRRAWSDNNSLYHAVATTDDPSELDNFTDDEISPTTPRTASQCHEIDRKKAFTPQVKLQILSYAILGYLKLSVLAVEPIFLGTPVSPSSQNFSLLHLLLGYPSGFGLGTTATSHILVTQAGAAMISQWFFVSPIIDRFGPLRSYRIVLGTFLGVFILCPIMTGFDRIVGLVMLIPVLWIYSLINTLGTTSQSITITNTAPDPVYLATINGANVMVGCLARTAGPSVSGALFRLGLKIGYVGVCFYSLAFVCAIGFVVAIWLREHA